MYREAKLLLSIRPSNMRVVILYYPSGVQSYIRVMTLPGSTSLFIACPALGGSVLQ